MDASNFRVRLASEEAEDVGGDFAFLRFPNTCPIGPQAGEAEQGLAFVGSEPDRSFFPSMVSYSENDVNGARQR
jgi:hypothetical protein